MTMDRETIATLAQVFAAIGTVTVAILAIWGEWFRSMLAAPKLELRLCAPTGNLTVRQNQTRTIYYHLEVHNRRRWSPAKHVRVLLTGYAKRRPDGTFFPEPVVAPLQLTWAFPQFHELLPTVSTTDTCDLGFLDDGAQRFAIALYVTPNNFRGFVAANEAIRVHVVARADNAETKKPLILELAWDGDWSTDMDEMKRHLVIREVEE